MMLLTLPIFMPVTASLGFDPIWFAVIILLAFEISLTTPPFDLLLFVMLGAVSKDIRFDQVVMAGNAMIMTILTIAWPSLALFCQASRASSSGVARSLTRTAIAWIDGLGRRFCDSVIFPTCNHASS